VLVLDEGEDGEEVGAPADGSLDEEQLTALLGGDGRSAPPTADGRPQTERPLTEANNRPREEGADGAGAEAATRDAEGGAEEGVAEEARPQDEAEAEEFGVGGAEVPPPLPEEGMMEAPLAMALDLDAGAWDEAVADMFRTKLCEAAPGLALEDVDIVRVSPATLPGGGVQVELLLAGAGWADAARALVADVGRGDASRLAASVRAVSCTAVVHGKALAASARRPDITPIDGLPAMADDPSAGSPNRVRFSEEEGDAELAAEVLQASIPKTPGAPLAADAEAETDLMAKTATELQASIPKTPGAPLGEPRAESGAGYEESEITRTVSALQAMIPKTPGPPPREEEAMVAALQASLPRSPDHSGPHTPGGSSATSSARGVIRAAVDGFLVQSLDVELRALGGSDYSASLRGSLPGSARGSGSAPSSLQGSLPGSVPTSARYVESAAEPAMQGLAVGARDAAAAPVEAEAPPADEEAAAAADADAGLAAEAAAPQPAAEGAGADGVEAEAEAEVEVEAKVVEAEAVAVEAAPPQPAEAAEEPVASEAAEAAPAEADKGAETAAVEEAAAALPAEAARAAEAAKAAEAAPAEADKGAEAAAVEEAALALPAEAAEAAAIEAASAGEEAEEDAEAVEAAALPAESTEAAAEAAAETAAEATEADAAVSVATAAEESNEAWSGLPPRPMTSASGRPGTSAGGRPMTSASGRPGTSAGGRLLQTPGGEWGAAAEEEDAQWRAAAIVRPRTVHGGRLAAERPQSAGARPGSASRVRPGSAARARPSSAIGARPDSAAGARGGIAALYQRPTSAGAGDAGATRGVRLSGRVGRVGAAAPPEEARVEEMTYISAAEAAAAEKAEAEAEAVEAAPPQPAEAAEEPVASEAAEAAPAEADTGAEAAEIEAQAAEDSAALGDEAGAGLPPYPMTPTSARPMTSASGRPGTSAGGRLLQTPGGEWGAAEEAAVGGAELDETQGWGEEVSLAQTLGAGAELLGATHGSGLASFEFTRRSLGSPGPAEEERGAGGPYEEARGAGGHTDVLKLEEEGAWDDEAAGRGAAPQGAGAVRFADEAGMSLPGGKGDKARGAGGTEGAGVAGADPLAATSATGVSAATTRVGGDASHLADSLGRTAGGATGGMLGAAGGEEDEEDEEWQAEQWDGKAASFGVPPAAPAAAAKLAPPALELEAGPSRRAPAAAPGDAPAGELPLDSALSRVVIMSVPEFVRRAVGSLDLGELGACAAHMRIDHSAAGYSKDGRRAVADAVAEHELLRARLAVRAQALARGRAGRKAAAGRVEQYLTERELLRMEASVRSAREDGAALLIGRVARGHAGRLDAAAMRATRSKLAADALAARQQWFAEHCQAEAVLVTRVAKGHMGRLLARGAAAANERERQLGLLDAEAHAEGVGAVGYEFDEGEDDNDDMSCPPLPQSGLLLLAEIRRKVGGGRRKCFAPPAVLTRPAPHRQVRGARPRRRPDGARVRR
jgi:hypothetical protein